MNSMGAVDAVGLAAPTGHFQSPRDAPVGELAHALAHHHRPRHVTQQPLAVSVTQAPGLKCYLRFRLHPATRRGAHPIDR